MDELVGRGGAGRKKQILVKATPFVSGPGSAKGVMFITLEDEGDIANLIIWPSLFEKHRLTILGGQMLSCRGGVIHVVAEHVSDHANLLRQVGGLDEPFTVPTGRGDEAKHAGGPDPRESAQLRSTARHTNALCEFQIEKERVNRRS